MVTLTFVFSWKQVAWFFHSFKKRKKTREMENSDPNGTDEVPKLVPRNSYFDDKRARSSFLKLKNLLNSDGVMEVETSHCFSEPQLVDMEPPPLEAISEISENGINLLTLDDIMEAQAPHCSSEFHLVDTEPPPLEDISDISEDSEISEDEIEMPATNSSDGNSEMSASGPGTSGRSLTDELLDQAYTDAQERRKINKRRCVVCNCCRILSNYRKQSLKTCITCLEFFKEFKLSGHLKPYFCTKNEYCKIDAPEPCPSCKDCWLQKCFKVGFNLEGPWPPNIQKERKWIRIDSNWKKKLKLINSNLTQFSRLCHMFLQYKIDTIYSNAFLGFPHSSRTDANWSFLEAMVDMPHNKFSYPTLLRISNNIIYFIIKIKGLENFNKLSLIQKQYLVSLLLVFYAVLNFGNLPKSTHDYIDNRVRELIIREQQDNTDSDDQLDIFLYTYRKIGCNFHWLNQTETNLCWAILALNPMIGEMEKQDISLDQLFKLLALYEMGPENFMPPNRFTELVQQLNLVKALAWRFFNLKYLLLALSGIKHNSEDRASLLSLFDDGYVSLVSV